MFVKAFDDGRNKRLFDQLTPSMTESWQPYSEIQATWFS